MCGYPYFSLWIPIALCKDLLFPRGPSQVQKPLYLVGTILNHVYPAVNQNDFIQYVSSTLFFATFPFQFKVPEKSLKHIASTIFEIFITIPLPQHIL